MKRSLTLLFVYLVLTLNWAQSQDLNFVNIPLVLRIPAMSLIDFAGSEKRITFIPGKGAEQIITPSTLDRTWLNYSSITEENSTNSISVNLSSGKLPAEIVIKLTISESAGTGAGQHGRPLGPITLTPYPQDIIIDIGSCYTGRGVQKGHQLSYSWEWQHPTNNEMVTIENIEIGVTYTITTNK